ncbi:MAG TPA: hypothetical protein VMU09_12530 [Acidimicrobiales bacterium]|nr:hypothetical protein [Acidimicrobiales bacterium]
MEKLVYLLWGAGDPAGGDELRGRLLADTAPALAQAGALGIGVNVHDTAAAEAPSPVPTPDGELPHVAEVSVWVDSYDRRRGTDEAVAGLGLHWAAYLVVESLYEDYGTTPHAPAREWPDGDRSPGVLTVSLIHRPAGLDEERWIERWHGTQSPLSARLQPRCRYVRNQVVRSLTPDAPQIDGIVEEAWPSAAVVADPMQFFSAGGDPAVLDANITAMLDSVTACLDLERLRNVTMSEYLVRSVR